MTLRKKDRTAAISKSIETGARWPLCHIDSRTYVQHNVNLGDGLGPLLEFFDALPPGTSRYARSRTATSASPTWSTTWRATGTSPVSRCTVGTTIASSSTGTTCNQSQSRPIPVAATMLDGPAEPSDPHLTDHNKDLARRFVEAVLIARAAGDLVGFLHGDELVQHNPDWGDSAAQLREMLATGTLRHQKLHHVFGEGNFALTISEGTTDGAHCAIFDLFRLSAGKVAEHWDVVEQIPPRAEWKNDNGKF